ncbi:MAG: SPASM domain-containing protein, partial [Bacteroidales bacterium]
LDFYCFLQGLNRFRVKHVTIAGKGEPLLNRDIIYFCNALEERRIHFTITTNGTHLADFIDDLDGFKYLDTIRVSVVDESNLWMISYFLHHKKVRFHVYPKVNETTKIKQAKTFSVNGYEGDLPYGFNKIKHCYVPFNFFIVNTDGTVNPCCECNVSVGNAFMAPFWNLKPFRTFRKKALDMKHLTNCDCPNCGHHAKF